MELPGRFEIGCIQRSERVVPEVAEVLIGVADLFQQLCLPNSKCHISLEEVVDNDRPLVLSFGSELHLPRGWDVAGGEHRGHLIGKYGSPLGGDRFDGVHEEL